MRMPGGHKNVRMSKPKSSSSSPSNKTITNYYHRSCGNSNKSTRPNSTTNRLSKAGSFVLTIGIGLVVLVLFIFHPLPSSSSSLAAAFTTTTGIMSDNAAKTPAFTLMVEIKFQDLKAKEEFVELIGPYMTWIKTNEPTTIAYECLFSDKDELQALLVERYTDMEEGFLKIHKSSQQFLEFRPKLKAMQDSGKVTLSGQSYLDSGLGFMGRN